MRFPLRIILQIILISIASCQAPKLVGNIQEAKKLEVNKEKFIGRPLKELLSEIEPKIKLVFGNPENKTGHVSGGTSMSFYFVEKTEAKKIDGSGGTPIHITIQFELEPSNKRRPFPEGGLNKWTKKETMEYGSMIIRKFRVYGEN